jgi:hypothetical protein
MAKWDVGVKVARRQRCRREEEVEEEERKERKRQRDLLRCVLFFCPECLWVRDM